MKSKGYAQPSHQLGQGNQQNNPGSLFSESSLHTGKRQHQCFVKKCVPAFTPQAQNPSKTLCGTQYLYFHSFLSMATSAIINDKALENKTISNSHITHCTSLFSFRLNLLLSHSPLLFPTQVFNSRVPFFLTFTIHYHLNQLKSAVRPRHHKTLWTQQQEGTFLRTLMFEFIHHSSDPPLHCTCRMSFLTRCEVRRDGESSEPAGWSKGHLSRGLLHLSGLETPARFLTSTGAGKTPSQSFSAGSKSRGSQQINVCLQQVWWEGKGWWVPLGLDPAV